MKNGAPIILLIVVVVLALGGDSSSFTPPLNKKAKRRFATGSTSTALAGWFDSKPSGGNSKANDDMFEAQQEILRARRGEIDKDERESKDANKKAKEVSKSTTIDHVDVAGKEDAAMHVDEEEQEDKFKFPWQK
jgi:hypothetical protein